MSNDQESENSSNRADSFLRYAALRYYTSFRTFLERPEIRTLAEYSERFRREAAAYADTREKMGRAEGKSEGKSDILILILTKRFGLLSKDLTVKITGMTDLAEIDRLIEIALDVSSLTEFTSQMK